MQVSARERLNRDWRSAQPKNTDAQLTFCWTIVCSHSALLDRTFWRYRRII